MQQQTPVSLAEEDASDMRRCIESGMVCDQAQLQQRLAGIKKAARNGRLDQKRLDALRREIEKSVARRQRRLAGIPDVTIPAELPIAARHEDIIAAIREHPVVIVAGETGSGKTTQLPKLCLLAGRGVSGLIGHTQPRRIAARSVAARIAEELQSPLGQAVGYKVRFSDRTHPDGYIKLMTDGVLLAELQQDHQLSQYDTLIIDEAHERSLNIDFLLGYLQRLLARRPDLRLIITSATINTERFSRHFDNAPIIEVSGRTYPVEIRYRPVVAEEDEDEDVTAAILAAIDEAAGIDRHGDILVFLSGEREIRNTAEALRKHHPAGVEILPLYSRLNHQEQNRIFQAHPSRRIVLATNVAETSLTVPGIRFVIDPGMARISRYSHRSKVQRLPIEKISQASANQRAGRCGRVSSGVCIRLYTEDDFAARPAFTEPEIQRTNLAAVILQMRQLELGNPEEFPFIDAPDTRYINDGFRLLQELGALDSRRDMTPLGRDLARFPIEPCFARMIMAASQTGCLKEVLIIVSVLGAQDPRERPLDRQQQADEKHAFLINKDSDLVSYLTLWNDLHQKRQHLSHNQFRKYCRENYLSFTRLLEWQATHQQLHTLVLDMGMKLNEDEANYEAIHRAILTGLIGNIGMRMEAKKRHKDNVMSGKEAAVYSGARNTTLYLFPGSGLLKHPPRWIMSAELVETTRLYARGNARIEVGWIEDAARHLLKHAYRDPFWDERQGVVIAFDTVTLYGLVLHADRRTHFGTVDSELAREIFIREALVKGGLRCRAAFLQHNSRLIEELRDVEDKTRRAGVVADEQRMFDFFDQLIPANINTRSEFERWRHQAEAVNPDLLKLGHKDILAGDATASDRDFPGTIKVNDIELPVSYCFNPGGEDDGVTVTIPLGAMNQLPAAVFEWLVPGYLLEKITVLLKKLPKPVRRQLVPIQEHALAVYQALTTDPAAGAAGLHAAISAALSRLYRLRIADDLWSSDDLPMHLRMRFQIVDQQQKVIAIGRDLTELRRQCVGQIVTDIRQLDRGHEWPDKGISSWDFGDLPESIAIDSGGVRYQGYPALADRGDSVGIVVHDSQQAADAGHAAGLKRLTWLTLAKEMKYLRRNLHGIDAICLRYAAFGSADELKDDLLLLLIEQCFFSEGYGIRSAMEFNDRIESHRHELLTRSNQSCKVLGESLELHATIVGDGSWKNRQLPAASLQDIQQQLDTLIYAGFLRSLRPEQFMQLPRYLAAIRHRLGKLAQAPAADAEKLQRIRPYLDAWQRLREALPRQSAELIRLRWMLEEFRVSLFAQQLGTPEPISPKRLDEQIRQCDAELRHLKN